MTTPHRLRLVGIAVLAVAACLPLLAAKKQGPEHAGGTAEPRVERSRRTARPPVVTIDRRDALAVARRFAAAYAAWDAGERDSGVRRHLRAMATADLTASLPREDARPVAQDPAALRLRAAGAYRLAASSYAVPLVLAGRRSFQVVTLIVGPTPSGARVTRLER